MRQYHKYILIFAALQIIITFLTYFYYEERKNSLLESDQQRFELQLRTVITIHRETAEQIFHVIDTDEIAEIFAKAHAADPAEKKVIRNRLYDALAKQYRELTKHHIRQLHFHLPNGESFLRMHKPAVFGDSLVDVRESVNLVIKAKKPVSGFEIGKYYNGFRNVFPLFDKDHTYIGSVEITHNPDLLLSHIDMESIHAELLEKASIVKRKIIGSELNHYVPFINDNYLKYIHNPQHSYINEGHLKQINKKIAPIFERHMKNATKAAEMTNINREYYSIIIFPIANIAGDPAAAYIIGYIPNTHVERLTQMVLILYTTLTLLNILLLLFMWRTSRARSLKQLAESLEERIKKSTEANLEQKRLMFEQARYAQLGEMMNMVAHQWRQPINAISAAAIQLNLKSELKQLGEHDIEETSRFIQKETKDMSQIINDFMNFFKPDSKKTIFNLGDTFDEVEKLIGPQLKSRGIALERNIDCFQEVNGHKKELIHIILNLIANARDALEGVTEEPKITMETRTLDGTCVIRVSDNGTGIDESIIERVFDPYFTTKEQGKGTGIGLYMAKEMIVKDFLGSLSAENLQTGGACFTITLPSISSKSSVGKRTSNEPEY